ncbi:MULTISPECIES: hypothetical protein [unclassified Mesorhizobium]|uniref:hypothetical protein n=1 Tax=unclassified Mesorhizobium TaxID=325217 RepID=UPI0003CF09F7|nr:MULTISPECIES: hypothetical protein [unclassified Mesorhizobium]ESY52070.1 hypothetical protein X745_20935 [Mesorhizobium sp. LNJC374B00]ESY55989.1 hypothetical protein X744_22440 [Mesorhizobium sp. LNJC372A00]WJI81267.1 hypothetical protein NLY34_00435 [Mesorhizobium sp. C374B]WJI87786.1 hypothetical protein NLY42_02850 [Mesorhizobium sp. C372A]
MGWWSSDSSSGNNGTESNDFDPGIANNKAEAQAAKDAAKESLIERTYSDSKAKEGADSLWSSIFGKK